MYLQAGLTVKYGKEAEISALISNLVKGMEKAGWRLDLAYRPVAGDVRQVTDLWNVADGNAVVDTLEKAAQHPGHGATMQRLSECLDGEVLQLMEPTSYAPPGAAMRDVGDYLVEQRLRIAYAAVPAISDLMPGVVETAAARGWRLVAALRPVLGDFTELLHLWQLADLAAFDPEWGTQLADHVVDERFHLLRLMPYSPQRV